MSQNVKKPSIAVFLNAFWVHGGQGMSGGDQMAIQIFGRIRYAFSVIQWFTNQDGAHAVADIVHDVKVSKTPSIFDSFPIGLSYVLRTFHAISRLFGKRVDIVYSGSDFFPDVLPAWLYRKFHQDSCWIQCVFHIYPDWRRRPGNKVVNWAAALMQGFSLRLIKHADSIININTEVRDLLIKRGYDSARLKIITPGIDIGKIDSAMQDEATADRFDAVFLGRLNPSKGVFDLPEIWKAVVASNSNARLGVIGGGSKGIHSELKSLFSNYGIEDNVEILGFVDTEQIYVVLKSASVFIFPSHEEGFGIAIVEALASGLPVVAWNLPVYNELFGDVVTVVTEGEYALFSKHILKYIDTPLTTKEIAMAKQVANHYGWDNIAAQMEQQILAVAMGDTDFHESKARDML